MKKILLLDGSQSSVYNSLGVQLKAEGFCIERSSLAANEWPKDVKAFQPDVILLEVASDSYVEQYQFCHHLRQDVATENIPVLLIGRSEPGETNGASVHYLLEGLHAGANDYLKAPYEFIELVGKIHSALRLKDSLEKVKIMAVQLEEVNGELYQRNIQIEKELYITRQLQQSLLPSSLTPQNDEMMFTKVHYEDEKLRISGIYLPCDALGGDLYDVLKFKDNSIGVSITDVSGHGVPAGFITAIFKTSLYRITHQITDPAEVLFHINNELFDIVKTGDYVTSVYLRIDLNTLELDCAGAGHPYPFFYSVAENKMHRLQKNGTPLIWVRDIEYPKDSIQLHPGDKVFLFTDGVSELRNPAEEMFGEERVNQILLEAISSGTDSLMDTLINHLSDFTEGAPLEDDISMVLIEAL